MSYYRSFQNITGAEWDFIGLFNRCDDTFKWSSMGSYCTMSHNIKISAVIYFVDHLCINMYSHALMDRPSARLETMSLVIHSYVLV